MPIIVQSQTPAAGALNHPSGDFYEIIFASDLGINPFWNQVIVTFAGVNVFTWTFVGGLTLTAGWEGDFLLGPGELTFRARFRPVGGWQPAANYGAGGGALIGRVERVRVFSEDVAFDVLTPAWDFATAALAVLFEINLRAYRKNNLAASAYVSAAGVMGRSDGVLTATRTGLGVYEVTLAPGLGRAWARHDPKVCVVANLPRIATISGDGRNWTVRAYDAAGAPADSNFLVAWKRFRRKK